MSRAKSKKQLFERRRRRVRSRVFGTTERPRLCVYRSNRHFFVQLIDDEAGKTLVSVSDHELKGSAKKDVPSMIGKLLGEKARAQKITEAVLDRAGNQYHGQIRSIADAAREHGLKF